MTESDAIRRYFTSYSGTGLPLKLVGELEPEGTRNRNTFFAGTFNAAGQLLVCEKVVYGETELRHDYQYHADGRLARAAIDDGEEPVVLDYPA